ncbi:MAG TPA: hypothetical protein PK849_10380 [Synergistales bacterium]|nr:hypothetical protein [Synergistales bacterium]
MRGQEKPIFDFLRLLLNQRKPERRFLRLILPQMTVKNLFLPMIALCRLLNSKEKPMPDSFLPILFHQVLPVPQTYRIKPSNLPMLLFCGYRVKKTQQKPWEKRDQPKPSFRREAV